MGQTLVEWVLIMSPMTFALLTIGAALYIPARVDEAVASVTDAMDQAKQINAKIDTMNMRLGEIYAYVLESRAAALKATK